MLVVGDAGASSRFGDVSVSPIGADAGASSRFGGGDARAALCSVLQARGV